MKPRWIILGILLAIAATGLMIAWKLCPESSPSTVLRGQMKFDQREGYVVYRSSKSEHTTPSRLVLVIHPDGDFLPYLQSWRSQADRHGLILAAVPGDWTLDAITELLQSVRTAENVDSVYVSGFSNGGYASCEIGLGRAVAVDGIIPMGAFCSDSSLTSGIRTVPILTVIGERDTWALGDDGQLPYRSAVQLQPTYIIVPGIGHQFPRAAMDRVGAWIMEH